MTDPNELERFAFTLTHSDKPIWPKIKPCFAGDIGHISKNQGLILGQIGLSLRAWPQKRHPTLNWPCMIGQIALRPVQRRATVFGTSRAGQGKCKTL